MLCTTPPAVSRLVIGLTPPRNQLAQNTGRTRQQLSYWFFGGQVFSSGCYCCSGHQLQSRTSAEANTTLYLYLILTLTPTFGGLKTGRSSLATPQCACGVAIQSFASAKTVITPP